VETQVSMTIDSLQTEFYAIVAEGLERNLPDYPFKSETPHAIAASTSHPSIMLLIGNHAPTTARAEVYISSKAGKNETTRLFEMLYGRKQEVEAVLPSAPRWFNANTHNYAAIQCCIRWDIADRGRWDHIANRLVEHLVSLEKAFRGPIASLPVD
jgi:hypothetical protein